MRWDRQNQFVIAGFVIAKFVSIYFTVNLPGFQMLFVITGFRYSGVRYSGVPLYRGLEPVFTKREELW